MTFAPRAWAFEMILQPEPESRLVTRTTLAPLARHWSACETIFCASPSAFTTVAAMPAFLKAAMNVGRSCVSHRTDDFVSGSSTQAGVVGRGLAAARERGRDRDAQRDERDDRRNERFLHDHFSSW